MELDKVRNEVLRYASDLKHKALDQIEVKWINHIIETINELCLMVYDASVATDLALGAAKEAMRRLERRGRFPTSFSLLTCDTASAMKKATKSDFERSWEVSDGATSDKYVRKATSLPGDSHGRWRLPLSSIGLFLLIPALSHPNTDSYTLISPCHIVLLCASHVLLSAGTALHSGPTY